MTHNASLSIYRDLTNASNLSSSASYDGAAIAESFRKGLQVSTATLNNISAIEILTIKRFIVESIGYFLKLIKIDNPAENRSGDSNMYGDEGSQSQTPVAVSRPLRRFRDV